MIPPPTPPPPPKSEKPEFPTKSCLIPIRRYWTLFDPKRVYETSGCSVAIRPGTERSVGGWKCRNFNFSTQLGLPDLPEPSRGASRGLPGSFQEASTGLQKDSREAPAASLQKSPASVGSKQIPKLSRGLQRSPGVMGKAPLGDLFRGIGLSDTGPQSNPNRMRQQRRFLPPPAYRTPPTPPGDLWTCRVASP